jgi:hypothetical protein
MSAKVHVLLALAALTEFACSGATPTTSIQSPVSPVSPSVATVTRVDIGVLGAAPAIVRVGETLQLFARAADVNGAVSDVTNLAAWSSADAEKATVAAGEVTGRVPGIVKVTATYSGASGTLDTTVAVLACASSRMTPLSRIFSARPAVGCSDDNAQYGERVTITASAEACVWSAASDVPWIGMDCYERKPTYTPGRPGSGALFYVPEFNNTPAPRVGHITVTFDDGSRLVHTVSQEAPGCSYQVSPTEVSVPKAGGSGSFDAIVSPADCRWTISPNGRVVVSRSSGTGPQRIDYRVMRNEFTFERTHSLSIEGLSGVNPPGTFTIRQAGR